MYMYKKYNGITWICGIITWYIHLNGTVPVCRSL